MLWVRVALRLLEAIHSRFRENALLPSFHLRTFCLVQEVPQKENTPFYSEAHTQ